MVVQHPKKSYLARLTTPGGTFDMAVAARQDGPGVVVTYLHKETAEFSEDDFSLDTMFLGDNYNLDGVVAVSDGTSILVSNESTLQGVYSSEFLAQFQRQPIPDRTGLIHLSYQGRDWYGSRTSSREYRLYAFFPASSVFAARTGVLGYTLAACILLLTVFTVLRHHSSRENLRQLEQQYRTISAVSSIYSSCFLFSLDGQTVEIIRAPEATLCRLKPIHLPQQVLDTLAMDYVTPEYRREFRLFADLATAEDRLADTPSLSFPFEDMSGRWTSAVLVPQQSDDNGHLQAVLLLFRDTSEEKRRELDYQDRLRRAAQQAERANLAKTDFLRRMSHDVRTPINGIRGMVAISRHYAGDEARQEECREKIMSASGFLLDLVNDVLDMNKLESGSVQLEERPFSLGEVVESVLSIAEIRAGEWDVLLRRGEMSIVHNDLIGSPHHLRQVLMNIFSNAVKYNRAGGSVTISCQELPQTDSGPDSRAVFRFTCADTGIGMSQAFQQRAFEPFAQEDTRRIRTMKRPDAKTVPIFALTANAFSDDQILSRQAGMNEHLSKPLDGPRLILLIRKYFDG